MLAIYLCDFGSAYRGWFELTLDPAALGEALRWGYEAVAVLEANRPARGSGITWMSPRGLCLANLGVTLHVKFEVYGDGAALEEGITVSRTAVEATADDDPRLAMRINYLGIALFRWYEWTGDTEALREAVHWNREAVRVARVVAAADGPPHRANGRRPTLAERIAWRVTFNPGELSFYLASLGITLQQWSAAERDRESLEEAVEVGIAAVAATPHDDPRHAEYLSYVSGAYRIGYPFLGSLDEALDELKRAIQFGHAAVEAAGPGDRRRGAWQANLALCLTDLFEAAHDIDALREAMTLLREAARQPGQALPVRAKNTMLYGRALLDDAEVSAPAVRAVLDPLAAVVAEPAAGVTIQVMAGGALVRAHRLLGNNGKALRAAEQAVEQLPQLVPQQLRRRDREHRLGSIAGIGAEAAAAAIGAGQLGRAVELLEQARGVLLGETMAGHSDLERLRIIDPGLAREFQDLRGQLAGPDTQLPIPGGLARPDEAGHGIAAAQAASRREAGARWAPLLARIRAIYPGFLVVPGIGKLAQQARHGPVVIVTSTKDRGDALIVTSDPHHPVRHVPLAPDTDAAARKHIGAVLRAFDGASGVSGTDAVDAAVTAMLGWAWDAITAPVLTVLGQQGLLASAAQGQRRPRLWWCPVGALAQIPLHAAGHYTKTGRHESVLDWAVSSYIPTIRALGYARRSPERSDAGRTESLIVAVPEVPQDSGRCPVPDLDGVDDEVRRLNKTIPGVRLLNGKHATAANVLAALDRFPVAHFACHCLVDGYDPGNSQLVLYDGAQRSLTAAEISRRHLPNARFAYLSACRTASTTSAFSDEALHATGAFLLAGYRDVIGTLWPVWDHASADMAEQVYRRLTGDGAHPPRTHLSAVALHEAVRTCRDSDPCRPSRWAAHIHVGG